MRAGIVGTLTHTHTHTHTICVCVRMGHVDTLLIGIIGVNCDRPHYYFTTSIVYPHMGGGCYMHGWAPRTHPRLVWFGFFIHPFFLWGGGVF